MCVYQKCEKYQKYQKCESGLCVCIMVSVVRLCVCVSVKELSGEEVRFSSLNISTRRGRSLLLFSCATRSERTSKNGCVIINFHKTISFLTHPQSDY